MRDAAGLCILGCYVDHGTSKPAGNRKFPGCPHLRGRGPAKTAPLATQKVAASPKGGIDRMAELPHFFGGRPVGSEISQNLRKLYRVLRWLAADRSAWTSGRARQTGPVQRRTSVLDLQRTSAASLPRIHLRMADRFKSASRMDAPGQIRH